MVKQTSSNRNKVVNKKSQSGWRQVWQDMQAASGVSIRGTSKKEKKDKIPKVLPSQKKITEQRVPQSTQNKKSIQTEPKTQGKIKLFLPKIHLSKRKVIIFIAGIIIAILVFRFQEDIFSPFPPSPNVVAIFDGGQITVEDVQKHIAILAPDEATRKQLETLEGYRVVVEEMINDEIIRRFAKERKTDQKKEITHVMQHITEEINIDELHTQMHKGQMGVNESDIKAYYDANRKDFGEQTLTQAKEQIRTTLQGQKEDTFVQNYIEGLKNKASITRDTSTLEIPEPQEFEVKNYFDTNRTTYGGKQFEEIILQVTEDVRREKEKSYYKENTDRTLFTVNGKRYTLGEFGEEYQELPAEFLTQFQGTEGKKQLVERIIERVLLYEDSLSQVSQVETKEKKDEMQLKVMAQILEQEEIDDKIKVTDEEIKKFYEQNKTQLQNPPQSKISQIVIKAGETEDENDDEHKRARDKATEAYKKLFPEPLKKGEDFAKVAREYSEDETTRNQGGAIDEWIGEENELLGELDMHEFHEQILAIPKGGISQPFEANGFFYIIQVRDRSAPTQMTLQEAKEAIRSKLSQDKHAELAGKLSFELRKRMKTITYTRTLKRLINN